MEKITYPTNMQERFGTNQLCIKIYETTASNIDFSQVGVYNADGLPMNNIFLGQPEASNIRSKSQTSSVKTTIFLPTPLSIATNYSVSYEDVSLTGLGSSLIGKSVGAVADTLSKVLGKNSTKAVIASGLDKFFKSIPTKEIGQASSAITGLAINPHQELLLNGVKFRDFKITYNLIAKKKSDSEAIKNIIKTLKASMHPELTLGSFLFKYPSEFELLFFNSGKNNTYLFRTKKCILKNLQVSYGGGKNFVTFKDSDGAPVEIELVMDFQETEILTQDDFEQQNEEY
jgi:hypothetical protein